MEMAVNRAEPLVMHIDLNSAFAMIEQQANPFLRHKPVAVTNRLTRGATIIAASYEAKRLGIGVGTKMDEAKVLAPNIVVLETDPPKYTHAYRCFKAIIESYSPIAYMKSIDEGVIDFSTTRLANPRPLVDIGYEIKARLQDSLGSYVTCNIGIGPSRWLAKVAAGLHKPDGLEVIDWQNLTQTYSQLALTDLTGINRRYQARLRIHGVNTPLDFLHSTERFLSKQVFNSITGYYWYLRLRGWEIDGGPSQIRTVGKQYVLHEWTNDTHKLAQIVSKMCEMMGRRLRAKGLAARGVAIGCLFTDHSQWKARHKSPVPLLTTAQLYRHLWQLFSRRQSTEPVKIIYMHCYDLSSADTKQLDLFERQTLSQPWRLTRVIDNLNDRFGEFSVMPATMAYTDNLVPDKIPFGSTRHLKD